MKCQSVLRNRPLRHVASKKIKDKDASTIFLMLKSTKMMVMSMPRRTRLKMFMYGSSVEDCTELKLQL